MNLFAFKKMFVIRPIVAVVLCTIFLSVLMPLSVAFAQTAAPAAQPSQAPVTDRCSGITSYVNIWCYGRAFAVYGSSAIIYVTGWGLGIAGVLLNASLELTVGNGQPNTGFESQIYARIKNGVEAVWTAFRDIANIIIIGMFTFTALTMILGIESFNARKMVAKVLLIAVLINFSLLFTRIIITSSNFVAAQFYKAAQFGAAPAESTLAAAGTFGQYSTGISGKFAQLMGVASFADTKNGLWKTAEKQDSGFMALGLGVLTAIVFVAAALVFLYAAFLLIARALLFIILLITSSLAFASHLVPSKLMGGNDGWSMWWGSLLKNAVFGPILLIMLWATIQLGTGIKLMSGDGTLGGLLDDATTGGNINALFSYLMILGMLYASIKIASSFSHKIGGFNFASALSATPLALGARLGGLLGRNLIGRGASAYGSNVDAQMEAARRETLRKQALINPKDAGAGPYKAFLNNQLKSQLQSLESKKKGADWLANRKFDIASTEVGKNLMKGAGVPGMVMGGGKGVVSFGESQKKIVEDAAKRAAEVTKPSDEQLRMVRENATAGLSLQKKSLEANLQSSKAAAQAAETSRAAEIKRHEEDVRLANAAHRNLAGQPQSASRDADMDKEKLRIETARMEIDRLREDRAKSREGLNDLTEQLKELDHTIDDTGKLAVGAVKDNLKDVGGKLARDIAYGRNTNILPWASGGNPENDETARKARSAYNKKVGEAGEEERILGTLRNRLNAGTPPTPPTP